MDLVTTVWPCLSWILMFLFSYMHLSSSWCQINYFVFFSWPSYISGLIMTLTVTFNFFMLNLNLFHFGLLLYKELSRKVFIFKRTVAFCRNGPSLLRKGHFLSPFFHPGQEKGCTGQNQKVDSGRKWKVSEQNFFLFF